MRPILKEQAQDRSKGEYLHYYLAHNTIPKDIVAVVPIKTLDPPDFLKQEWNQTLKECGFKLIRLFTDHHRNQIVYNKQLAEVIIMRGKNPIIPEVATCVPNITVHRENSIENLINKITFNEIS